MNAIAVIPAAGRGTRLGETVPGSKEVAEVGGEPAIGHLFHRLELASIRRALLVLRHGKWDIPLTLLGHNTGVSLAYVIVDETPSQLHSVARGLEFVEDETVVFGYPDVLFKPEDAFGLLLKRLFETGADVVIGLFPNDIPERVDMVSLDEESRPVEIVIKQPDRGLLYSWSIAVWTPAFSRLMRDFVCTYDRGTDLGLSNSEEPSVGHVIQKAIGDGFQVEAVAFPDGGYIDMGTPEDLEKARLGFH